MAKIPIPENINCLFGLRCPECKSLAPFEIVVSTTVKMYDDGSDGIIGNIEWTDESYIVCSSCNKSGKIKDFKETENERSANAEASTSPDSV